MTEQSQKIGFIGLGAMGMGMACSLLRAGFQVKGFDINPNAVSAFAESGGVGATSVADAAQDADIFIIVVVNADQVEDVLFGSGSATGALPTSSVVMLCSTVKPDYAKETANRLAAMGLAMLDSPISGGSVRAVEGELSIMASGPAAIFEKAQAALDAMAAHVYRMGEDCGQGSAMKMINQLLAGVHIAVAGEAMAFAAKSGIDPEKVYEVICNSAGGSWMFQNRVPHILAGDYTPHSAIDIWVKDLGIVLETGKTEKFPLPLAAAAHQLYLAASASGHGRLDDAAVVKVYEQLTGVHVAEGGDHA